MMRMRWMIAAGLAVAATAAPAAENTLAEAEAKAGWTLLFDGASMDRWMGLNRAEIGPGWKVIDGTLTVLPKVRSGDIITRERYSNFEFSFEFRLTEGANSGIKYFICPTRSKGSGGLGCEYQVLDDERHRDAKAREDGSRTLASLYDILPAAADKPVRPIGEWNHGRIVVRGRRVEHWLNGAKVLEYERGSPPYRTAVAASKFSKTEDFGEWEDGHLLIQDHNDEVAYRNLKIRVLD